MCGIYNVDQWIFSLLQIAGRWKHSVKLPSSEEANTQISWFGGYYRFVVFLRFQASQNTALFSSFLLCSSVRPLQRWHRTFSPVYNDLDQTNHTSSGYLLPKYDHNMIIISLCFPSHLYFLPFLLWPFLPLEPNFSPHPCHPPPHHPCRPCRSCRPRRGPPVTRIINVTHVTIVSCVTCATCLTCDAPLTPAILVNVVAPSSFSETA